jgi:hypothetical protein
MTKEVNHQSREHSKLSASGSERWLNCPASVKIELEFPNKETDYSNEGTLAHEIADIYLRNIYGNPNEVLPSLETLKNYDKFYNKEMDGHVKSYVDIVSEFYNEAQAQGSIAFFTERRFDLREWIGNAEEEGFGTVDNVIIADGAMRIIDLKFGKGVKVDAIENSQLMLYALGAYKEFRGFYEIDRAILTIVQPRLDHISEWEISIEDLIAWGEFKVKPKAKEALEGKPIFKAGQHCKFCRGKNSCRALAENNMEYAKFEFRKPPLLDDLEIVEILSIAPAVISWLNGITEFAADQAINYGKNWPGFKIVAGRSNRVWTSEQGVVGALQMEGFSDEQIFNKRLKGITEIEKVLGKKEFNSTLSAFVHKPEGKPTLVPENDPREIYNSLEKAQKEFV